MSEASTCTQLEDCKEEAKRLIEQDSVEVYDYAATIGQQVDNVRQLSWFFIEGFALWLHQGEV
ncbi:MAG: hypothetical protein WC372_10385 [Candidatus Neomarinimicrobiota bacterium]|jgi:hypothetical protein